VARMNASSTSSALTRKERGLRYALYTSRADLNRIYVKDGKRARSARFRPNVARQGFYDIRKFSSYAPACRAEPQPSGNGRMRAGLCSSKRLVGVPR